jgi:putative hemolysin
VALLQHLACVLFKGPLGFICYTIRQRVDRCCSADSAVLSACFAVRVLQMLVLHSGQPFIPVTGKHVVFSQEAPEAPAANDQQCSQRGASSRQSQKSVGSEGGSCSSPDSSDKLHWRHNQYAGRMFSKHLKQVY